MVFNNIFKYRFSNKINSHIKNDLFIHNSKIKFFSTVGGSITFITVTLKKIIENTRI